MPATNTLASLVGSWRLLSWANTFPDTGERIESFGPHPEGRMVFTEGSRIMFLFMKSGRQVPVNDSDRAAMFNDMVAYSGLVRLTAPGTIVTTVDLAWSPFDPPEQTRFFTVDGDRLTIRTPAQVVPLFQGRECVGEIVWLREKPLSV